MAEFKYAFDQFGTNPDNKLIDEEHEFNANDVHVVQSIHGLFYAESLVLIDEASGNTLTLGADYQLTGFDFNVTAKTGKTVAAGAALIDTNFVGTIKLTCQLVGGPEGQASEAANNLARAIDAALANPSVDWVNITNRPAYFPPELHRHNPADLDDLDKISDSFRELTVALRDRRPFHDSLHNVVEQQERMLQLIAQLRKGINSIVAVTGSAEQLDSIEEEIKVLYNNADVDQDAFTGIGKTIGEWAIGSKSRIRCLISFTTDVGKVHSFQVDIAHDGVDTNYAKSSELKTGDYAFDVTVQESLGLFRLNVVPLVNGTFKAKFICAI